MEVVREARCLTLNRLLRYAGPAVEYSILIGHTALSPASTQGIEHMSMPHGV